jgi:hypothetical protein
MPPLTDVVLRAIQVIVITISDCWFTLLILALYNGSDFLMLMCVYFKLQAARKTAENAINLKRVEDQVNNAVIAANKAATAARVAAVKAVQNRMDGKFCETFV